MNTPEQTIIEREKRYGCFTKNADIAQNIKAIMRLSPGWNSLHPFMKEALDQDASKTSRILSGDPFYLDSWHDKAGYATRVAQLIEECGRIGEG